MAQKLSIGILARETGVKVNTVRFYEDAGIMPLPERTASGRRTYSSEDVRRLRFVRRARALGFSLDEVRSLLELSGEPDRDCAAVNGIAQEHLRTVEDKIEGLLALRDELTRIGGLCAGGRVAGCRVLEVLASAPTA